MKYYYCLFTLVYAFSVFGQHPNEKSVYQNLPVKKFYSVSTESAIVDGKAVYKANGRVISKEQFLKYSESKKNLEECKPCILETYDQNEKLVIKAVQYKDCCVGEWTAYYPSGKIKTSGHYRENETGIWDPLWDNGYCIKHGVWTEFNEKGKPVKTEVYNFGNLKESK